MFALSRIGAVALAAPDVAELTVSAGTKEEAADEGGDSVPENDEKLLALFEAAATA